MTGLVRWGALPACAAVLAAAPAPAQTRSSEPVGDEDGFGLSFGAGVQYDFTPEWGVVAQWDRHHMKLTGRDRENVDALSVGVKYKF
jgi:predicted porin